MDRAKKAWPVPPNLLEPLTDEQRRTWSSLCRSRMSGNGSALRAAQRALQEADVAGWWTDQRKPRNTGRV